MPFQYYGGKKGLARYYPPPAFGTIIEPFAGSAGYALHWATPQTKVVLIEKDPAIVAIWRRLQAPDALEDVLSIDCPTLGDRTSELLVVAGCGGSQFFEMLRGATSRQVTSYMVQHWPSARSTLADAVRRVRGWTIIEGDYTDAPDTRATWFVDPPSSSANRKAPHGSHSGRSAVGTRPTVTPVPAPRLSGPGRPARSSPPHGRRKRPPTPPLAGRRGEPDDRTDP